MTTGTTTASPGASPPASDQQRFRQLGIAGAIVVLALCLGGLWAWNHGAEQRAIRHLAAPERRALYERTLGTLRAPCEPSQRPQGLEAFCRKQALFILEFPDCDAACAVLARRQLLRPAR
jgi:hypothetical protein